MYGFVGKQAWINLSEKSVKIENVNEEDARLFGGCVGYSAKILWDHLEPRTDALGANNILIFATGPLTGTLAPSAGSWEACFKSPLTNVWGEARSGGSWGPRLKQAGFDFLIVTGRSDKPVYLWMNDGQIEIRSAEKLVGKNVIETDQIVKEEIGDHQASVAAIGQAGENKVRFAAIMNDIDRAAGRCGGGAVMGSKNLKAVAANGTRGISLADPEGFREAVTAANETMIKNAGWEATGLGTIALLPIVSMVGDLPTKYAETTSWERANGFYDTYLARNFVKKRACWACNIGCARYSSTRDPKSDTPLHGGPEYESVGAFGAFLLQDDVDIALRANYLCDVYGMDTISCGHAIGYAMKLYDKGIIDRKTTGMDLTWGNADSILTLIEMIAKREGFGDILAEGIRSVSMKFGDEAQKLALHVKGLEMPMHDPRCGKSLAIQYGTGNRGMCHMHPIESHNAEGAGMDWGLSPRERYGLPKVKDPFSEDRDKSVIAKIGQDYGILYDTLGVCKFPVYCGFTLEQLAKLYSTATGWKLSDFDMLNLGERVFNLQRCFNVREGISRKDDMIPFGLTQPATTGPAKGVAVVNYESMLNDYYELRGWDINGIPTKNKLVELDLKMCVQPSL
ncbi:MAG: aldehyde ferredoxin oxidoreductase family protein [Candidatus Bathyarchaeia archaeon]